MKQKPTRAPIQHEASNGLKNDARHHRHGAHRRPGLRHRAVLHQPRGQRLPQPRANARDGWGYCVFGKVVEGMDVVDKIAPCRPATRARTRTCR